MLAVSGQQLRLCEIAHLPSDAARFQFYGHQKRGPL
jgi:hypothetical protein